MIEHYTLEQLKRIGDFSRMKAIIYAEGETDGRIVPKSYRSRIWREDGDIYILLESGVKRKVNDDIFVEKD